MKSNITKDELLSKLIYDKETGCFKRIVNSRRRKNTLIDAGCQMLNGYVSIHVSGITYYAHRLAWLYVYGEWPNKFIDHINGIRNDNRISNLRIVTSSVNCHNKKILPKGVTKKNDNLKKPYYSRIRIDGKYKSLGYFENADDASKAYMEEKLKIIQAKHDPMSLLR